ncbi:MAG TPA: hypothetical protein DCS19_04135 [Flavobacterium sp.]|nr:hypothetical protein [Flavobacterium sp.]
MMWRIWLASSDVYTVSDANSEIDLSSLPGSLAVVNPTNWVALDLEFADPTIEPWTEGSIGQRQKFTFGLVPFSFPSGMDVLKAIAMKLAAPYKYICMDGAGQEEGTKYPYRFITEDKAMLIESATVQPSTTHDHEAGQKVYQLNCNRLKPLFN